jgi:RNA polymerase sigma-70 factor (ECF subfamily)
VNLIPDVDHGRLISFVARIVGTQDAEDVVQTTYVKVLSSGALFRGDSTYSTWVHRIAERCALDHLRWGKRHPEEQFLSFQTGTDADEETARYEEQAVAESLPCPLIAVEQQRYVRQLLARIPKDHADALWAYVVHGTFEDAARVLGLPITTLKARAHRARTALRLLED